MAPRTGKGNVVVRDLGWQRIVLELARMENAVVDVGVHSDAGSSKEGTPIAAYGAYNEYGAPKAGVPERSFMRSTFDETIPKLNRIREKALETVYLGRLTAEQAAAALGEQHQGDIQRKIRSGVPPPNKPATIKRKGSSTTLNDDGLLRQSIRYEVGSTGRVSLRGLMRNLSRLSRSR